jgi:hypothetical protein
MEESRHGLIHHPLLEPEQSAVGKKSKLSLTSCRVARLLETAELEASIGLISSRRAAIPFR